MSPFKATALALVSRWRWLLLPPVASVILVQVFVVILNSGFKLKLLESGVVADMLAITLLGYWLYALLRPWWLYLLVQTLLVGTLYLANAYKIAFFDLPVKPEDFDALPVLLDQVEGWRFLLMASPLVLLGLLFLAGLRWRWLTPAVLLGGVLAVAAAIWLLPAPISGRLDSTFGYLPFADVKDFTLRGPLLYLLNEETRDLASAPPAPTRQQVLAALNLAKLPHPLAPVTGAARRDVYVFMMETFWDPSLLTAAHYDRDPLAPAFRKLWEQAGESKAMVPVFGSGTPNSEFEMLCGEPAYDNGMVFMRALKRPMMCMPRILARLGYSTAAITPDDYGTWNRGNALHLVGFERFYDGGNLKPTDRNGLFISNTQLFQQVDGLLAHDGLPAPRFTFISTDSGHYPFELNPTLRPDLIHTDSNNPLVKAYANVVYYDSQELADYIGRIRSRDPDALIVAFGDHLPVLRAPDLFARSHLWGERDGDSTPEMLVTQQSTVLLVIDGTRGPLKLGHLSLFEVPRLVLSLLDVKQATELDAFALPPHLHVRTLNGRVIVVSDDGHAESCAPRSATPLCSAANPWTLAMRVLRGDILSGHDYADEALYGTESRRFDLPLSIPYLAEVPLDAH